MVDKYGKPFSHLIPYLQIPVIELQIPVIELQISVIIRDWIGLSMVLRLRQHNIGYTADGFYRSDDLTNSVKALKEGG